MVENLNLVKLLFKSVKIFWEKREQINSDLNALLRLTLPNDQLIMRTLQRAIF